MSMSKMEWAKTIGLTVTMGSALGFALVACDPASDDNAIIQRDANGQKTGLVIFTDHANGCQYVRTLFRDGITPRMGKDGKQMCG